MGEKIDVEGSGGAASKNPVRAAFKLSKLQSMA